MVMRFTYSTGATPIDPDEAAGLVPTHITTQAELNAWEEANIVSGEMWAFRRKSALLDEGFLRALHLKMFDQTWRWAGQTGLGSPFPNGNGRHARMMATSVARSPIAGDRPVV